MCLLGRSFTSKLGTMQKVDLELDMHDDNGRQKVMRTVASLSGIKTIDTDMEYKKLTVFGKVDTVKVTNKLRKSGWDTKMVNSRSAEKDKNYKFYRTPVDSNEVVLKLEDMHDNNGRQKVMRFVSKLSGIQSMDTDMEHKKLRVVGAVDTANLVNMLRKSGWRTELVTSNPVGAAKEANPNSCVIC